MNFRHNIGAPPLRGCLDHLSLNDDVVDYTTTIGVVEGCPVSLLVTSYTCIYVTLRDVIIGDG